MQNLFQDLSKKGRSTKIFHEITVKTFFVNTINEDCLNPIHMQKILFSYPTAIKQTTNISINVFNNRNTHDNDNCQTCDIVKLISKSVIGIQKSTKQTKSILVAVQHL